MAGTVATLPAGTDLAGVRPLDTHLFLADDTARPSRLYRIMEVDAATRRVTLDAAPTLAVASDWEIGTLVRRYEVFLPAPGDADRGGINLPTSRADPVAYAQVGVSAADDKDHTADDPDRAGTRWGGRSGNEGRVSGPATVYRVHRTPPPAPRVPPDSDRVYASAPTTTGTPTTPSAGNPRPTCSPMSFVLSTRPCSTSTGASARPETRSRARPTPRCSPRTGARGRETPPRPS